MARKEKVSKVIDGDTFETAGASTATWTMRNQTSGSETPPCRFVDWPYPESRASVPQRTQAVTATAF